MSIQPLPTDTEVEPKVASVQKNKIFSSAFFGIALVFSRILTNLVLLPLLTHSLGGSRFGLYILLLGLAEMILVFELGFSTGVIRQLGYYRVQGNKQQIRELLGVGSTFYIVMSVLISVGGYFLLPFWGGTLKLDASIASLALPAAQIALVDAVLIFLGSYFKAILVANHKNVFLNIVDIIWNLAVAVSIFCLLAGHYDITYLLGAKLLMNVFRLGALMVKAALVEKSLIKIPILKINQTLFQLLDVSVSQLVTTISVMLSHSMDSFILAAYLPIKYVGLYEMIKRMLSTGDQVIAKLRDIYIPTLISQTAQGNHEAVRNTFLRTSQYFSVIYLVFYAILIGFYPEIFQLLSQGSYDIHQSVNLFVIALIYGFSGVIQVPASTYFLVSGKYRFLAGSSLITGVLNFTLSWILVQKVGFIGPALGTLLANVAQHQFSSIGVTIKQLNIKIPEYLAHVYGTLMLPSFVAVCIIALARTALYYNVNFVLVFLFTSVLLFVAISYIWFEKTASKEEKDWLYTKLSKLLNKRALYRKKLEV
jgi:O-antigen/teichoic acid export membrane protein